MKTRILRTLTSTAVLTEVGGFSLFMYREKEQYRKAKHEINHIDEQLKFYQPKPRSAEELEREQRDVQAMKEHLKEHPGDAFFIAATRMGIFAIETHRIDELTNAKKDLEIGLNKNLYGKLRKLGSSFTHT